MAINPIDYGYPLRDRTFNFNEEELSTIELAGRTAEKVNEVIAVSNGVDARIAAKEDSANITNNRKLSPNGNFTGTIAGKNAGELVAEVDSNSDKISYLAGQFSNGQTGLVIDGGFFENSNIKANIDGGLF
jgi:hypothetical protein